MSGLEQDLDQQLKMLKQQLEQVRLTQRDSSFKYQREQKVLTRMIASLCHSQRDRANLRLNQSLDELCQSLEQNKDVSLLIPKISVVERLLRQQSTANEKHGQHLDTQVKQSGETLLRITGLPAKLKRDLRDLLSYSHGTSLSHSEHITKLLSVYERALKVVTANPEATVEEFHNSAEKELLARLSNELQHLITELDFEGEYGERLLDIRAKLLLGLNTHSLLEITLQTLRLVVEGTKFERKTSEQFVDTVNQTLSHHLANSGHNLDQTQSYFQQRVATNREIQQIVQQSHRTVSSASTLEGLQMNISPLLEKIAQLSERLQLTEEREQALIERVSHSRSQIESLYEVSQDYRRRLELQAQKMQRDPLTKALNRNALLERLDIEYRKWIRHQNLLRVVLLDIDNFKVINDNFGYTAGDKALKIIVRTMTKELHASETLARFSGEEFVLILPERNSSDAHKLVKNLQNQVSKLPFKFKDQNIMITFTAAVTMFADNDTPEVVMDRLNHLLNQTKQKGPNQLAWQ